MTVDGVRDAVAAGHIGQEFVDTARKVARVAVRTRPSPSGGGCWSDNEIDELVNDTVVRVGPDKLVLAAGEASNDREFSWGWLKTALRTTLDLRARTTPAGRVIRAMDDALREEPDRFCLRNGHWRLKADDREPARRIGKQGLVSAAWTVETDTVRLSQRATKTPPMAYRRDIRAVCAKLLELSGPLAKADLAEVLAHRFNVPFEARFDYLDLDEGNLLLPRADSAVGTFEASEDQMLAYWMFEQLTEDERSLLRLVRDHASLRDLASALGCSRYRAGIIRSRLVCKLGRLAKRSSGDDQGAVEYLLKMVGQHTELRHYNERAGAEYGN